MAGSGQTDPSGEIRSSAKWRKELAYLDLETIQSDNWRSLATPDDGPKYAAAAAMVPADEPCSDEQLDAILARLRLATVARDESPQEQIARFNLLRAELLDFPAHQVWAGCKAYAREHKWWPVPAELLPYIRDQAEGPNALLRSRLSALARECARLAEQRSRANSQIRQVDPGSIDALFAPVMMALNGGREPKRRMTDEELRERVIVEWMARGFSREEAEAKTPARKVAP